MLSAILVVAALQDSASARAPAPTASIPRIDTTVVVNGRLDEPVWSQAARLSEFRQFRPVDGRPAEQRTDVLVWYAPDAIHFGIVAHDRDPGSIRATQADRDNLGNEDRVTLLLDTFNDQRRAFMFAVNPLGSQADGVRSEGQFTPGNLFSGSEDLSPDYTWDSKGMTTDSGYVVEVRIPFKSLRVPSTGAQTWGLNIVRITQRNGYEDTWADTRRASSSFLAQSGTITGLENLERGIVVELQPYATATLAGARDPVSGAFERDDIEPDAGGNLRLGFTNFSIDATINPDFSTIEADEGQVTVNERFALFFEEKRPFFLEGIELFATPNQLVYTRQIGNPIAGGKFTGKFGKFTAAYLAAVDDAPDGNAVFNVGRLRYDLGSASTAGVTVTDRERGSDYNRVISADAHIVFARLYFVEAQLASGWTREGGVARSGPVWKAEFDRTGRSWGFNYQLNGISDDFVTRTGFVNRTGIVTGRAFNRLSFYGPRGALVENFTTFFGLNRLWDYSDFELGEGVEGSEEINFDLAMRGGWQVEAGLHRDFVGFDPADFAGYSVVGGGDPVPYTPVDELDNMFSVSAGIETPTYQSFGADFSASVGEAAIFDEAALGYGYELDAGLNLRPATSMRVELEAAFVRIFRDSDDSEFARAFIPRLKVEYQPTRALFFRMITEYQAERRAPLQDPETGLPVAVGGTIDNGDDANGFRTDLLAAYEPTPGTAVFLGYGTTVRDTGAFRFRNLQRESDGLFLKVSYLIRK